MEKTFYGVWFCGNDEEPSGLCYDGRSAFITNAEHVADNYRQDMEEMFPPNEYIVCKIVVPLAK